MQELEKRAYYRSPWPRVVLTNRRKVEKYLEKQHSKGLMLEIESDMFTFARKREDDGLEDLTSQMGQGSGSKQGDIESSWSCAGAAGDVHGSGPGAQDAVGYCGQLAITERAGGSCDWGEEGEEGRQRGAEGALEAVQGEGGSSGTGVVQRPSAQEAQEPGQQGAEGATRAGQGICGGGGGGSAKSSSGSRDAYFEEKILVTKLFVSTFLYHFFLGSVIGPHFIIVV